MFQKNIEGFVDFADYENGNVILRGWAINNKNEKKVKIEVFDGKKKLSETYTNLFRKDLLNKKENGLCGFEVSISYSSDMEIIVKADGKKINYTDRVKEVLTKLTPLNLNLIPLLIMPTGRNGTTMLMSILKTSDEIIFEDEYPYEKRYFLHFLHLCKTLMFNYKENDCWNDEKLMQIDNQVVGPFLFDSFKFINKKVLSQQTFKFLWDSFNNQINSDNKYKYFAEKSWIGVSDHLLKLFNIKNVKKILLLRDPRSVVLSVYKFNKKRGFNSFGWKENDTLLSYTNNSLKGFKFWFNYAKENINTKNILIIRYEDLVLNLENEVKKIEKFLNIKINLDKFTQHNFHMTSKDIKSSINSWKSELESEVVNLITDKMKEELKFFGYEE